MNAFRRKKEVGSAINELPLRVPKINALAVAVHTKNEPDMCSTNHSSTNLPALPFIECASQSTHVQTFPIAASLDFSVDFCRP
jgi:hypothetical protein